MRIEREFAQSAADRLNTFLPVSIQPCPSDVDGFGDWLQLIRSKSISYLDGVGLIVRATESPEVEHGHFSAPGLVEIDRYFVTTTGENWRNRYSEAVCVALVEISDGSPSLHLNDANGI